MLAFGVYSLVFCIVFLPGLFGNFPLLTQCLSEQVDVSAQTITLTGLAGTTLLAGMAGSVSGQQGGRSMAIRPSAERAAMDQSRTRIAF